MWVVRLFLERWPIVLVAPVLVYAGYSWREAAILTAVVIAVADVVFAIVRAWLLERQY